MIDMEVLKKFTKEYLLTLSDDDRDSDEWCAPPRAWAAHELRLFVKWLEKK